MKKRTVQKWFLGIRLVAGLVVTGTALGQTNKPHPSLVCDESLFDYGVRPNSVEVEHNFIIRNSGNLPLVISQVRSGCGCTQAKLSQNTIEPGTNAVLSTRLTLRGVVGPKRTHIYLHSNDPENPVFQCQLSGSAVTDLAVTPQQVTFTYSPLSPPTEQQLIVTGKSDFTARITAIKTEGSFFHATITSNTPGYGVIIVTPTTNAPVEVLKGIVIISTDHPRFPQLTVPIVTSVIRDLNAYPPEIVLDTAGHAPPGNVHYIILRGREDQPFTVTNVVVIPPLFPARLHSTKPAWARLKVGPIPADGVNSGAVIRVYTDKAGASPLDIPVRATPRIL